MQIRIIAALVLITAAPTGALAQTATASAAPGTVTVTGAQVSAGLTLLSRVVQMQQQARSAMLGALTPPHRALLAQTVGQLAISPDPNLDAAAARLDSTLSPAELQAIDRIAATQRAQIVSDAGQLQNTMTPEQVKQAQQQSTEAMRAVSSSGLAPAIEKMMRAQNDPGHLLLLAALSIAQPFGAFSNPQGR